MDAGYADATAAMPQILERVSERWSPERYAERREEFRAKWPPLWFSDYKLEGCRSAGVLHPRLREGGPAHARTPAPMGFEELRDNLYAVLAGGDFTMDFPHVRYDSLGELFVRRAVPHQAKLQTDHRATSPPRPSTKLYRRQLRDDRPRGPAAGRRSLSGADLYVGAIADVRISTCGSRCSSTTPIISRCATSARRLRQPHQIDNTSRSRTARASSRWPPACPRPPRGLPAPRQRGHINYRYDSDVLFADDTDHSRYSFFGLKPSWPATPSTSSSIRAKAPTCGFRAFS